MARVQTRTDKNTGAAIHEWVTTCAQCGREHAVPVQDLAAHAALWSDWVPAGWLSVGERREGELTAPVYLCSWRCLRAYARDAQDRNEHGRPTHHHDQEPPGAD